MTRVDDGAGSVRQYVFDAEGHRVSVSRSGIQGSAGRSWHRGETMDGASVPLAAAVDVFVSAVAKFWGGSSLANAAQVASNLGEIFESVVEENLCGGLVGTNELYLQVPMAQDDGRPTGDGVTCSDAAAERRRTGRLGRRGTTIGHSFPDFLITARAPSSYSKAKWITVRSFVTLEIKLRPSTIKRRGSQFRTILRHARRWSFPPYAAVWMTLTRATAAQKAAVTRAGMAVGVYSARLVSILR